MEINEPFINKNKKVQTLTEIEMNDTLLETRRYLNLFLSLT